MKRLVLILATVGLLATAPAAQADFGLEAASLNFTAADDGPAMLAGSHPFEASNEIVFNTTFDPLLGVVPDGQAKDLRVALPVGLVGTPGAVPRCTSADFVDVNIETKLPACSDSSAVGTIQLKVGNPIPTYLSAPVYNLVPPPGSVQKLGFNAFGVPVTIEFNLNPNPPYNVIASLGDIAQPLPVFTSALNVWGNPASPAHDSLRGSCIMAGLASDLPGLKTTGGICPSSGAEKPFLTLPTACTGPLITSFEADSWQQPGSWTKPLLAESLDGGDPPTPIGISDCAALNFKPTISAQPTTRAATSPTGLDFSLDIKDEGIDNPTGRAQSDIRKAVVTLPEGFTTNPSLAEGLNVCSEADLARETFRSAPGAGCPNGSKVGTVEVETPLLEESVNGSLFVARPYENEVGSLVALYMVIRNPKLGIVLKQALKVETDPVTGQISTVADDLPQLPFSHFKLHFREGSRSPLASPPGCGSYDAKAVLTPWSGTAPVTTSSTFQIIVGAESGPCPSGGTPPFHPGLVAGTINNAAGSYSPFNLRLTRNDGEQEFTRFSIKLPPGIVGKLAGIPYCPDAAIAAAKARTGPNGGAEELAAPSCPAASQIGRTLVGAGVGPSLAYAPGKVYLAGPYNGSALSIAAITAAKVGPFDLGTVVVREAIEINPETAEVFIDSTGSDPIPHIIKGIPVHARDIRVYVDRSQFILNPTNCTRTSTASTVLGSGTDFGSAADDNPFTVTSPFQAADCAALGFEPKLQLSLRGGTNRAQNPALKAVLSARPGDANIGRAQVTLPRSAFLDQGHIRTICTRVQFNAGAGNGAGCPSGSVYGTAKALTPILSEPVEGPVFLRANGGERELPDLVAALHSGQIDFNLLGYIDSGGKGQIRTTFATPPDVPVSSFTLNMQGGRKGLIDNSTNLCRSKNRALANFTGQNGKKLSFKPVVKPLGCKKTKGSSRRSRR